MKIFPYYILIMLVLMPYASKAGELSGNIEIDERFFAGDPVSGEQRMGSASIAFQPEYFYEFERSGFTFTPFVRIDSADDDRTHYDIRELNMLWYGDNWEVRAGIGKVFWGVTESQHLVDIINQTDLIESIDFEEKLGQPMISLSLPRDFGTFEFFVLPYFRERTFPGAGGRLRSSIVIDTDNPRYESQEREKHIDAAARYSHTIGDFDIGIAHFRGTGREPSLIPDTDACGNIVLIPYYEQIEQTGLDLQLITDAWLWKLESIYRSGQGEDFYALTAGLEYTFSGVTERGMDIGVIVEWLYDDRGESSTNPFNNDIMYALRFAFNDIASSDMLMGVIQDYENNSAMFTIESSRRLTDNLKINLEAYVFDPSQGDLNFDMRDDDYIDLGLTYYF